jgi:TatD DNase family protein
LETEEIETLANGDKVVAIGEIGLDYFHNGKKYRDQQIKLLELQIDVAKKDALEIIDRKKVKSGIIHCYTQGPELAQKFIERGFYISIPGIVTFKSAKALHKTVREISINFLLLETDAPYLAPEPMRGKINTSSYIAYTADYVANLKNMDVQDIITATATNAKKVFKISLT